MANLINLLDETHDFLGAHGLSVTDIQWVGSLDGRYAVSWDDFTLVAMATDYDNDLGVQEIANDLVVVASDWWLERWEHAGSEGWSFKQFPVRRPAAIVFSRVRRLGAKWDTLAEINDA